MSGETLVTIIGNLTDAPELRFIQSGAAVANFTVASTPRTFDKQANDFKDGETLFMRCSLWRDIAENVAESLVKGQRVIVTGRLVSRSWEQDGNKRTAMEMQVEEVGPSLRFGTTIFVPKGMSGGPRTAPAASPAGGSANDQWASAPPADEPPF